MDRGAWQATVHRVTKSQTQLKQLSMYPGVSRQWLLSHQGSMVANTLEESKRVRHQDKRLLVSKIKKKKKIGHRPGLREMSLLNGPQGQRWRLSP